MWHICGSEQSMLSAWAGLSAYLANHVIDVDNKFTIDCSAYRLVINGFIEFSQFIIYFPLMLLPEVLMC